jgi:septal ring factor EnvC (AmiA/AmiB activator)
LAQSDAPQSETNAGDADAGGSIAQRYERARAKLEEQRAKEDTQRQATDKLRNEAESLRQRLIANAARVQELETKLADTEHKLTQLSAQEKDLQNYFARDRDRVARLMAVLQRLETGYPPALALRPDDSLAAARGAAVLGDVLKPVAVEVSTVAGKLRELADTRTQLDAARQTSRTEQQSLTAARAGLASLLEERARQADVAETELGQIHTVTEDAARETSDLKSLIDKIAALRRQSSPDEGFTVVTPQGKDAALKRGSLLHPVTGDMQPGDPAGPGRTPGHPVEGLWFESQAGAQAVAPADGEIVFSGPYQKFGQVLILEIAGNYHLLLAGLGQIDVRLGDLVLAGEPVGKLPQGATPQLYMELRRNGQTLDPAPWMSTVLRKAKG